MSFFNKVGSSLGLGSPNKAKNKTLAIAMHLSEKGKITSMDSINLYGATRLSAIIFTFRKRGIEIASVDKKSVDRFGKDVTFAEYTLVGTQENMEKLANLIKKGQGQ
jgi:hypothetical protein